MSWVVQENIQILHKKTEQLIATLHAVLPSKSNRRKRKGTENRAHEEPSFSPADIFGVYQQEQKRFNDYTQHWQQEVAALYKLDQLFIIS